MSLSTIFFWQHKTPLDNAWHPLLSPIPSPTGETRHSKPSLDLAALSVDSAPFIAGAGAVAHLRQWKDFGFTAHASIFRNPRTLQAMYVATWISFAVIGCAQAIGAEYRYLIPRWSQERERRRDEAQVRQHVDFGMMFGGAVTALRLGVNRVRQGRVSLGSRGLIALAPIEVVMGGALADLMHREYGRAHNL